VACYRPGVSEAPAPSSEAYFSGRYSFDPGRARVWKAIVEHLQRYVPRDAAVCELGAGYADFINQLDAAKRYAVDRHPGVASYCGPGVTFLCGESTRLALPDTSVDVVFASNLWEHLDEAALRSTMAEVRRVLRPRGRLILLQPNYYYCYRRYWDDFTHVKAWTHESLPDFLRAHGYAIERCERRFLPFSFKGMLPKSYWLTRLYLALPWRPLAAQMLVVARQLGLEELAAPPPR
jgi:SAM-dependent methyltransferase